MAQVQHRNWAEKRATNDARNLIQLRALHFFPCISFADATFPTPRMIWADRPVSWGIRAARDCRPTNKRIRRFSLQSFFLRDADLREKYFSVTV
jgi:hypothetical protein